MSRIRALRLALKEQNPALGTTEAIARAVGVRREAVEGWERGLHKPRPRHLRALARVFGVSVEELEDEA